jgi:cellulase
VTYSLKFENALPKSISVVLAMSIWNDPTQQMAWLDAGMNGPCASGSGSPSNIQSQHPDTRVVFSNIRWGDIGTTTKG